MLKRGQIIYKAFIIIIVSVTILAAFTSAGKSYGSQDAFYKLALARDIALTIDTLYGISGNVEYNYPNIVSGYDIEISQNIIKVYVTGNKADTTQASYRYAGIASNLLKTEIKNQKKLKFEERDNTITITGVPE